MRRDPTRLLIRIATEALGGRLDQEWRARARCRIEGRPVEEFFAGRSDALEVCRRCEVTEACLEYALAARERGVWGGTTEAERRRIARRRRATEASPDAA